MKWDSVVLNKVKYTTRDLINARNDSSITWTKGQLYVSEKPNENTFKAFL